MNRLDEVHVGARGLEGFESIVGPRPVAHALELGARVRASLRGACVWNVNSTAVGGGVAEMLRPLLAYVRGVGIDARWIVLRGRRDFFRVTKRLHHALHGSTGDGSPLDEAARALYERVLDENAAGFEDVLRRGDVVILHDPQTAGLAPRLAAAGARVVWRCHIGHDERNDEVERGWAFLRPYLDHVDAHVFSRRAYVPDSCDHGRASIIPPSIDPFAPKNQELGPEVVHAILGHVGVLQPPARPVAPTFQREDGSVGRVERYADVLQLGPPPEVDARLVVQVSRWDPLKDHRGVLHGVAACIEQGTLPSDVHLVLAGPNVHAVVDDPEGAAVFEDLCAAWRALPHAVRRRVHLAMLPTADTDENAAIVNALQRHATVIVQKSLHEGFGLTVTEAMWKARAVLASGVGGIQDQIVDGESGLLLKYPTDLKCFGDSLQRILADPALGRKLGDGAHERVRERYLGVRHLADYAQLIERLTS